MPKDDMALPEGKTCNDCRHYKYCSGFIGNVDGNKHCDWAPSRFVESFESESRDLRAENARLKTENAQLRGEMSNA